MLTMKLFTLVLVFVSVCYGKLKVNEFGIELLYFTQSEVGGHVVFAPFGIFTLLTGINTGTTGDTNRQLNTALSLKKSELALLPEYKNLTSTVLLGSNEVALKNRNYLFLHNNITILDEFRKKLLDNYMFVIKVLDFGDPDATKIANTYIERSGTNVSHVFKSSDFEIPTMLLANVMQFKGILFDTVELMEEPFYNEENEEIGMANMMFTKGKFAFSNMKDMQSFAVELPYGNSGKYSLLIILPYPVAKISYMYQKFENVSLQDIFKKMQDDVNLFGLEDVHIKLPRFHIKTNIILNKPLYSMGIYNLFNKPLINFERATKDHDVFVSSIVHIADIKISANGNVAKPIKEIPTPYFNMNRPFLYFVIEKTTATVIFSGIYSKPSVY